MSPTYEYKCDDCDLVGELFAPMSKIPEWKKCPKCGKRMRRKFSAGAGVIWHGDPPPGLDLKRQNEDKEIRRKVRKAKHLKSTGRVPKEEVIKLEDRCLNEDYK